MLKPESLRKHLATAIPELARNPDQLLVFIDNGSLASTAADGLSFEYRYTLNLILTDYAGHPDTVMVPLLIWIGIHQNELLANPGNRSAIAFDADLLANDKVDLSIRLPLTERVGVHPRDGGGYNIEHYPEPQPEAYLTAENWQLYLQGQLLMEWSIPPR